MPLSDQEKLTFPRKSHCPNQINTEKEETLPLPKFELDHIFRYFGPVGDRILFFLDGPSLENFSVVCKYWHSLALKAFRKRQSKWWRKSQEGRELIVPKHLRIKIIQGEEDKAEDAIRCVAQDASHLAIGLNKSIRLFHRPKLR